jgi:hypothetical protein
MDMQLTAEMSSSLIDGLAQTVPFRFVDRVLYLDEQRVITELYGRDQPLKFVAGTDVDTYVMLEYAAQSSGLILRAQKQGQRGVIASFQQVERTSLHQVQFPIRLESRLVEARKPMYSFEFAVFASEELIVQGAISIFIGG